MTASELAKELIAAGGNPDGTWKLRGMQPAPEERSRRPIFLDGDVLRFHDFDEVKETIHVSGYCEITAAGHLLIFGGPVELRFVPGDEVFATTQYGRVMQFGFDRVLIYQADYVAEPHHHPDESGEGDPAIPPPP